MKKISNLLLFAGSLLFLASCNVTKLVPKDDALYTGATIRVKDSTLNSKEKKRVKEQTSGLTRPKPNSKILGIPFKLMLYNMGGDPKKKGFFRNFFHKAGEPPVLLSRVNVDYNVDLLRNYLENIGYFHARAEGDTVVKKQKGHAYYTLTPGHAYKINKVEFLADSAKAVSSALQKTEKNSLLRKGDPFNLEIIKAERSRIDARLKEEGYYFFSPGLLIVDADSTVGEDKVDMYLHIKEDVPQQARKPYTIDEVFIYPDYRINAPGHSDTSLANSANYKGYQIIDRRNKFKPSLFPRIMLFDSGSVYNRTDHNLTLSRLINLDVFKFVKNRFELSDNQPADTGLLHTYYYLTPQKKKSLRADIVGNTKSNNYLGSQVTLTFRNRNTFRGAEHLDIYANAGSEVQYSGHKGGYNTYRLGGGVKFTIPRFVVPFFEFNTTNAFVPRTVINLSYDLLNRRKLYTLNSFKGELGYNWKPSLGIEQELNPISINYVKALNVTQEYKDSVYNNPILKHAIDTQFILGSNYNFTLNTLAKNPQGSGFYFNGLADLSGNVAGLLVPKNDLGKKVLINAPFAQYLKMQLDGRYYWAISKQLRLANRLLGGLGYPYGNSTQLPFIKQFFIGGNNSIRAFRSRSLGPGSYINPDVEKASFLPDQSGDIKLEANTELRYKINKIFELAAFVDAGNIWLYNKDEDRPGANFSNDFLKEIAVGTGIGLRLDVTILLLRLDLAMPLRKPWLPEGDRWVMDRIDFSSRDWRRDNLIFNLAIGYPF